MGTPSCARAITFAFFAVIPSLLRAGATFETQTPLLGSLRPLPPYATTYAPLIHLYSGEDSFPSDIAVHLAHTIPEISFTPVEGHPVATVSTLNDVPPDAFLTSIDRVEAFPEWLASTVNKPDGTGYSSAPATIIAVEKEGGKVVDVFYFYFYSFNRGPTALGVRFGNHVGYWEHTMVRFVDGLPEYIFLSEHGGGTAFTYGAIEKTEDGRPKAYVATGTHAMYATSGAQDIVLPFGVILDVTDAGPLWDVTLNYRGYWFDGSEFSSAGGAGIGGAAQETEGVSWLYWLGRWGDEQYPLSDRRQYGLFGFYHYVSGPTGPLDKNLTRVGVCPVDECDILDRMKVSGGKEVYYDYEDVMGMFKEDLIRREIAFSQ